MADAETAQVEVVYALAQRQPVIRLSHRPGMTAREAVENSGLAEAFPEIASRPLVLAVFGHPIEPDRAIEPGDRVEICRPLQRDPRDLRRIMLERGAVVGASIVEEPGTDVSTDRKR